MQSNYWTYPDAVNARNQLRGKMVDMIKVEFMTVPESGQISVINASPAQPNAFSVENATFYRQNAKKTAFTISCRDPDAMEIMFDDKTSIPKIVALLNATKFDYVETDFEPASHWTEDQYNKFLKFLTDLKAQIGTRKIIVDVPPITRAVDKANGQNLYLLKYEDVAKIADIVCIMAYDKQYDYGAGTAVTPLKFLQEVCTWALAHIPKEKIDIGLPGYGYRGKFKPEPTFNQILLLSFNQAKNKPGYATAKRNIDAEMEFKSGDMYTCYQDETSIKTKAAIVQKAGIGAVSVWYAGAGNKIIKL